MDQPTLKIVAEERIKALQRENELLKSIFQSANDSIYAKDLEGRYLTINRAGAAYINRSVHEVIGQTDKMLFGTDESDTYMKYDSELYRTGNPVVYVSHHVGSGETRYFRTSKSPLVDADGKMIGLIGVSRDITAAHLAEMKYRFIFENAPIAFWEEDFSEVKKYLNKLKEEGVTDLRKHFEENPQAVEECIDRIQVLDVNGTTLKMYDAGNKELFVQKLRRDFTPESEKIFNEEFIALADGKTSFLSEGTLISDQGEELSVLFKLNVLPGHEQDLDMVLISIIDITETRKLEKRSQQALVQGQENERIRVSQELHDGLGQLITAVKLNIQQLRSEIQVGSDVKYENLTELEKNIEAAIREVKIISRDLMPDVLSEFGLAPALEDLVCKSDAL